MQKTVLVAGSHGTIGRAIIDTLRCQGYHVISISRHGDPSDEHLCVDMTDQGNVERITGFLTPHISTLYGVIQCAGVLHNQTYQPEKNLMQLDEAWLHESMRINVLPSVVLAQALSPLLNRKSSVRWISLSAKVGSIEDNGLGGWYSYRMSKAALNMFIKNLATEWGRKSPESSVIAMHPGTTPSDLSEPFTKNWPKEKLYSPEMTASRIVSLFTSMTASDSGQLYHHDHSVIPW
ncbi:SDR family NAD(P)-dependent oxidoreductase [Enterovibrio norvegicus]|uniref:SDR family NAD(P)-dependent oxidoreductase n=1 Tax=Enterovibrio norvegicus TaxID=188144 RepID=UPI000C826D73|nr:SDR family NAD(P)-dependent oxidoreductase [Enterovibrio norvegicus]PMI34682.1 cell-cell signaling protein CsgA [Enterovibrio norvegicus]TKF17653.1 SDR family NAD(P)-dependent oxidoreductase [Enterovibrio norvegicus]